MRIEDGGHWGSDEEILGGERRGKEKGGRGEYREDFDIP